MNLTDEQRKHYYEVECLLASRLRAASKEERRRLYAELYDELFRSVPFAREYNEWENDPAVKRIRAAQKMHLIGKYLKAGDTFLEVGPGDCGVSLAAAAVASRVFAVDVSMEAVGTIDPPENFSLVISDGVTIPVSERSIDVMWSAQLMEHLHPDDAYEQLENMYRALRPGGVYICITPNRMSGPHDISEQFADVAEGFHLHEYTNRELHDLFRRVGFRHLHFFVGGRGIYLRVPFLLLAALESVADHLPHPMRKRLLGNLIGLALFGIIIIGAKPRD